MVRKDDLYAEFGVGRRAYLDPYERDDWWLRAEGTDHREPVMAWHLDGWPELRLDRAELLSV